MPYELSQSSTNPRLLILLTDELEESVKIVNRIIDLVIQLNYDGYAPKNRCFISVIGYNQNIKDLCSGWLKDLDSSLFIRHEISIKKVPDGAGGLVDVRMIQPIWMESMKRSPSMAHYVEAIKLARDISQRWIKDYVMSPIIIDCSENSHVEYAEDEITKMRNVSAEDGPVLFWGCYPEGVNTNKFVFSNIPKGWLDIYKRCGSEEIDCDNGVLNKNTICSILGIVMDCAGEVGLQDF